MPSHIVVYCIQPPCRELPIAYLTRGYSYYFPSFLSFFRIKEIDPVLYLLHLADG